MRTCSIALVCLVCLGTLGEAHAGTVAAGANHTIVARPDGSVWTWGSNSGGQIGDGTTTTRSVPTLVSTLSGVVAVAAGASHTLALRNDGAVYAWGNNSYGQLGDGTTTTRLTPVLAGVSGIVAIAAGDQHSAALASDGRLWVWGRNTYGQIGKGTTTSAESTPYVHTTLTSIAAIGAGASHTLAVTSDGAVWTFGLNANGQLGDGSTTNRTTPVQMNSVTGAAAVAAGDRHSLVLHDDGTLHAVGYNGYGQLGDGTTTQRTTPVAVTGLTGVTAIAAGQNFSVAVKSDATVAAWGQNSSGQLGDGTTTSRVTPTAIPGLSSIGGAAAGVSHAVAVSTTGVVWTWGANGNGQLGDGTTIARSMPAAISGAGHDWTVATPVFSVNAGTYTTDRTVVITCATPAAVIHYTLDGADPTPSNPSITSGGSVTIDQTRTLRARAYSGTMPESETRVAIYTMQVATPGLSPSATTYTSPQNVAISTATPGATIRYTIDGSTPTASSPLYTAPFPVATTTMVKAIGLRANWTTSSERSGTYTMNFGTLSAPTAAPAAGAYTGNATVTLSAAAGATIRYTTNGSDPTASSPLYSAPLVIGATTTLKAKAFHPDHATSPASTQVYTITTPAPVLSQPTGEYAPGALVTVTNVDPAAVIRITLNGATPTTADPVVTSGSSLAVGAFTLRARAFKTGCLDSDVAEATYTLSGALSAGALAAGNSHTVLSTPDGLLWAWGQNGSGQLGDGTTTARRTPRLIQTLTGVKTLAAGASHTLAVTTDGRLFAWGSNGSGRLGDGTTTSRSAPVAITALANVAQVAAGDSHSLALLANGTVYAWGAGSNGQLGLGSTSAVSVPTPIPGLSDIIAIAAGASHSVAVTADGQLYAWGLNNSGQLGDGSTTQRPSPTLVNVAGVTAAAAGSSHTLARTSDGSVYSWGAGSSGQLGLGSTSSRNSPNLITGLNASAIAAGASFSAALRSDGSLVTFGANGSGQLGDGTTTGRTSPTVIGGIAPVMIALGSTHAAAVESDGTVWTWGAGSAGQLGDGSTPMRTAPGAISEPGYLWRTATPVFSVTSGTYTSDRSVVVTVETAGAVIHYTQNGAEPAESDPTIATGSAIVVDRSQTLKVKAWTVGMPASATGVAEYVLKVVTPTFAPSGGSYTTAQAVSMSTTTPTATIRYTTDGSEPTAESPSYTGPVSVTTTTTLKAAGFRADWARSDTRSSTYTMNFGALSPPTASPAAGAYTGQVTVTLSALAGATIRYTTTGSDPNTSSPIYTQPLVLSTTTTLKAKAFHPDYTTSTTSTQIYTLTLDAPTLSLQSGAYAPGEAVVITHPDPDATIRLTLNGADPTAADPSIASGTSLTLGGFTLRVRAFRSGATDSAVSQATYTLTDRFSPGMASAGENYSTIATPDGLVYAWGSNQRGQLGDGATTSRNAPKLLQTLTGVTRIDAGQSHTLAATFDGRLFAWGYNATGQLGDGTTTQRTLPVLIPSVTDVVAIAAGTSHSLALTADGTVYAWGDGQNGQLGLGSTASVSTPTAVPGLSSVVAIAAGDSYSLALTNSGQVYAWGLNDSGQLGDGTQASQPAPALVTSLGGVTHIAAGRAHVLARTATGQVYAWGANSNGQVGDGTTQTKLSPTLIGALSDVQTVGAGWNHSLAVTNAGAVYAWGANASGQLGDGTTGQKTAPTLVPALAGIAGVTGGSAHSVAIDTDGAIWTWGRGSEGQLGQGSNVASRPTPQAVTTIAGLWGDTPVPIVAPAGGTYNTTQMATVSPAPGTTVHYTTSGEAPTEADPTVPASGEIAIDGSVTIRLRAWSAGRGPSAVVTHTYVLQSVAPTITPAAGVYADAQTITLSGANSGIIRYTLDGSDPTDMSQAYANPFILAQATTLKARTFRAGWQSSSTTTAHYVIGSDQTLTLTSTGPLDANGGSLVTLSAEVNDLPGLEHSYSWVQSAGPFVTIRNATHKNATIVAPAAGGALRFTLTVTNQFASATTSVDVVVSTFAERLGLAAGARLEHTSDLEVGSVSTGPDYISPGGQTPLDIQLSADNPVTLSISDANPLTITLISKGLQTDVSSLFTYDLASNTIQLQESAAAALEDVADTINELVIDATDSTGNVVALTIPLVLGTTRLDGVIFREDVSNATALKVIAIGRKLGFRAETPVENDSFAFEGLPQDDYTLIAMSDYADFGVTFTEDQPANTKVLTVRRYAGANTEPNWLISAGVSANPGYPMGRDSRRFYEWTDAQNYLHVWATTGPWNTETLEENPCNLSPNAVDTGTDTPFVAAFFVNGQLRGYGATSYCASFTSTSWSPFLEEYWEIEEGLIASRAPLELAVFSGERSNEVVGQVSVAAAGVAKAPMTISSAVDLPFAMPNWPVGDRYKPGRVRKLKRDTAKGPNFALIGIPAAGKGTKNQFGIRINYTPVSFAITNVAVRAVKAASPSVSEPLTFATSSASRPGSLILDDVGFPAQGRQLWTPWLDEVYVEVELTGSDGNDEPSTSIVRLGRGEVVGGVGLRLIPLHDAGELSNGWTQTRRYSTDRDAAWGSDGWGRKQTLEFLERHPELRYNDLSLEHGGMFPPHSSHQTGVSIDVRYLGGNYSDGALNGQPGSADGEPRRQRLQEAQGGNVAAQREVAAWIRDNRQRMAALFNDSQVRLIYVGRGTGNRHTNVHNWNRLALIDGQYENGTQIIDPDSNQVLGAWTTFVATGQLPPINGHLDHIHIEIKP